MPPTLIEDHLESCYSQMSRKLDNSKESNLHVTLKKRSVTGIAEKDRTKLSFFGEDFK